MKDNGNKRSTLRAAGLASLVIGTLIAVSFTLYTGRFNKSFWLILLFAGWVSSPFACLALGYRYSFKWRPWMRTVLYSLSIIISILSSIYYSGMVKPADVKTAFVFLAIPFLSWVILIACLFVLKYTPKS